MGKYVFMADYNGQGLEKLYKFDVTEEPYTKVAEWTMPAEKDEWGQEGSLHGDNSYVFFASHKTVPNVQLYARGRNTYATPQTATVYFYLWNGTSWTLALTADFNSTSWEYKYGSVSHILNSLDKIFNARLKIVRGDDAPYQYTAQIDHVYLKVTTYQGTFNLNVNSFVPEVSQWSHVGTEPWLHAAGDNNYIQITAANSTDKYYTFETDNSIDFTPKTTIWKFDYDLNLISETNITNPIAHCPIAILRHGTYLYIAGDGVGYVNPWLAKLNASNLSLINCVSISCDGKKSQTIGDFRIDGDILWLATYSSDYNYNKIMKINKDTFEVLAYYDYPVGSSYGRFCTLNQDFNYLYCTNNCGIFKISKSDLSDYLMVYIGDVMYESRWTPIINGKLYLCNADEFYEINCSDLTVASQLDTYYKFYNAWDFAFLDVYSDGEMILASEASEVTKANYNPLSWKGNLYQIITPTPNYCYTAWFTEDPTFVQGATISNSGGTISEMSLIDLSMRQRCSPALRPVPRSEGEVMDTGTYILKTMELTLVTRLSDNEKITLDNIYSANEMCTIRIGDCEYSGWFRNKRFTWEYRMFDGIERPWKATLTFDIEWVTCA